MLLNEFYIFTKLVELKKQFEAYNNIPWAFI